MGILNLEVPRYKNTTWHHILYQWCIEVTHQLTWYHILYQWCVEPTHQLMEEYSSIMVLCRIYMLVLQEQHHF